MKLTASGLLTLMFIQLSEQEYFGPISVRMSIFFYTVKCLVILAIVVQQVLYCHYISKLNKLVERRASLVWNWENDTTTRFFTHLDSRVFNKDLIAFKKEVKQKCWWIPNFVSLYTKNMPTIVHLNN